MGKNNARMSPKEPLGVNTIAVMLKEACAKVGLDEKNTGHGLRGIYISTLANNPSVNIEECLVSARHSSVSAQRPYIRRNETSECVKFDALGVLKK